MDYYFYNTDRKSIDRAPRSRPLIEQGFAATGGERKYGEQLGRLAPGDTLLMYENGTGVVAVGTVRERWDEKSHRSLLYYATKNEIGDEGREYRIKVDWFLDLSNNAISVQELKKRLGVIPPNAVQKIVKARDEVARIIAERIHDQSRRPPSSLARITMTDDEVVNLLKHLIEQGIAEHRAASDNYRRGRFQAGWEDITKKHKRYDDLDYLTWTNLGNRCGVQFGDQPREQIRRVYEIAAALYETARDQALASDIGESIHSPPERVQFTTTRIIRDTAEARRLKKAYECRCQVCGGRIELGSNSFYAEVHHIRPLGGRHRGLDAQDNMLVVCPTHHAVFDLGVAKFSSDKIVSIGGKPHPLTLKHRIATENLDYHNAEIVRLQERGALVGDMGKPLESSLR